MRVVCGWCSKDKDIVPEDESITHTVCPQCEEGLLERYRLGMGRPVSSPNGSKGESHAVETNSNSTN